jgi:hypothetical protein
MASVCSIIGAKDAVDYMDFLDQPRRPSSTRPEHARKAFFKVFFKTLDGLPEDLADLAKVVRSESKLLAYFE